MAIADVITEGFIGNAAHWIVTEGFSQSGVIPPSPPPPPSFDPLQTHGGQGRRRWDRIRTIYKERPDDEVLGDHVAALVAHLLGDDISAPVARKAAAVVRQSAAVEAIETGQYELAETRAIAALLETKVAGLERQKAILRKQIEDENDDEEAMELILGHA